jgi:outer membrane cobalamin receptor
VPSLQARRGRAVPGDRLRPSAGRAHAGRLDRVRFLPAGRACEPIWARATGAVALRTLRQRLLTFGYSAYGDPRLVPERSLGIDAAVDQTLASGKLHLSAAYFRTRLEEAIIFDFSGAIDPALDPFGRSAGYRSVGTELASGVEITASATPSASTRLSAAYTFVDAESPTGVTDAPRALGIPRHQIALVAFAGLGRPLTASLQVVAMSEVLDRIGRRVLRFDGPFTADAQLSYRLPLGAKRPVRVQVRVLNLLDRTQFESGFRTPGRTVTAGASLAL